jgi:hypothetical protein
MRNVCIFLIGYLEKRDNFEEVGRRGEENIRLEIGWEVVDWIHLA